MSSLHRLRHAAQKQSIGLIILRVNKQDFVMFVEAKKDDGREEWKGLGSIPQALLRYF